MNTVKKKAEMTKEKKLMGVQQCLIRADKETMAILEYLCSESNKLHNCAVYYARQIWFKTHKFVTGYDLANELKTSRHFSAFHSQAAQSVCHSVGESIKSFSELLKKSKKGELDQKPKFPNYRKPGYQLIAYPSQALKLVDGMIRFPLGMQVKAWFGLKEFFLPMPSNLDFAHIREIRIFPRNGCFYAEFVYPVSVVKADIDTANCLGIDHGINNWLTCVSNVGTSFIIDGLHLKSINQWYNKSIAKLMEGKPNGFWSKRLARATEKRNRQMRDAVNKTARLIINHCLDNRIGTLVFGWNKGQKNSANMGSKTNQKFVQIPTGKLKDRITQLCDQYGIKFVETEESYTSKASFVDRDFLPTIGAKPDGWKESGKRVKRGLYRTGLQNWYINADCNGASNILRKVATILGLDLSGVGRGVLTAPLKIRIWSIQESLSL